MAEKQRAVTFTYKPDKAFAALTYLAASAKVTLLDKKKASSLLYLADKAHLLRYGRPIFGEEYRALKWGAVAQRTLDALNAFQRAEKLSPGAHPLAKMLKIHHVKGHDWPIYSARVKPNMRLLSELEKRAIDAVIDEHGAKTFDDLDPLIHDPAWKKAWRRKPASKGAQTMLYEELFESDPRARRAALEYLQEQARIGQAFSGLS